MTVKLCPNCNANSLMLSRILEGDAKNMVYCKSCFWSEPEDKSADLELIKCAMDIDFLFNLYVSATNDGQDVSCQDVNSLIKDLYRMIIERSIR